MERNKIRYIIIALLVVLTTSSCEDWLNLYPENAQTTDQYWQTKEDVLAVVSAGYVKLQKSVDKLFVWGEIRGNGISIYNSSVDDNIKAADDLREMDILPTNLYAKWGQMYEIINIANSVIKYAPDVVGRDESFSEAQMNSYLSEAYFLRSLAYFYLVRTFRDVPLILDPYVNDEQEYEIPQSTADVVLDKITDDLNHALIAAKEFFPEVDYDNPVYTKGRATKWAIHSLLADIYLWRGEYDKCIASCDKVINSGRVGLISKDLWFTNFFPGNTNESIFEIQFDYNQDQTNDFIKWFSTDRKYRFSVNTYELFYMTSELGDIRGDGASISLKDYSVWKYLGIYVDETATAERSTSTDNDQNYIIYRLADIYLMKAEALTMLGNYNEATAQVARVRQRAGIEEVLTVPSTEIEMLVMILNERGRELFAEGKCWFDLLRVAQRDNYKYIDYFISEVLKVIPVNKIAIVSSKLIDPDSHYLPVHQDELNVNTKLVQNPYYSSLGN
ncbi:MAG: RagB/SusD family nutrient uptake outer membrane protein [Prolixibacteraceae bacterium]|nr:RagB/SusD family nutrient uptake outer membrane protein [Prolixibacteraceae bacterium]